MVRLKLTAATLRTPRASPGLDGRVTSARRGAAGFPSAAQHAGSAPASAWPIEGGPRCAHRSDGFGKTRRTRRAAPDAAGPDDAAKARGDVERIVPGIPEIL